MLKNKLRVLEMLIEKRGVSLADYNERKGLSPKAIEYLEDFLGMTFPSDLREFYNYKDGSGDINIIYKEVDGIKMAFRIYSEDEIVDELCHEDNLPMEGILTKEEIQKVDKRIKPFLFNKKWLPIGELMYSSHRLYLDLDPSEQGKVKQIIAYVHDPDFVYYLGDSFEELIDESIKNLEEVVSLEGVDEERESYRI